MQNIGTQQLKNELRQNIIQKCMTIDYKMYGDISLSILDRLRRVLDNTRNIAIYHATNWEVDLSCIIKYCSSKSLNIYQPVAYRNSKIMKFIPYDSKLKKIFYEPQERILDEIKWYNLDLILVPLLGVSRKNGCRLGRGGGYYDATFAGKLRGLSPLLCGIGFACQIEDVLPQDLWDIKLDYFCCETELIRY